MHLEIRRARRDDGPAYVALVRALAEFERLTGPDEAAAQRLLEHAFGPKPAYELIVAAFGADVVAYAAFFTSYSTFRALPGLWLEDLFVHPKARRQGVATRMLVYLEAEARRRGCGRFEWMVLDWNEDAQKLYDKIGAKMLSEWRLCRVDIAQR